jgi:putative ABC transport system permease protein
MTRTQIAELFVGIRKTFVSFFSILMFVALGVGIFLGINWSSPALQKVADEAFSQGAFHHFQVQYPYGLTDEDLVELAAVEGVTVLAA